MAGRPVSERASVEAGSSSKAMENTNPGKGQQKPGPWPPKIEPFIPNTNDYNPRELKSWAKRTGFNPNFSGETISSISERDPDEKNAVSGFDFEKGPDRQDESSPKIEIDPVLGRAARTQNRGIEIEPVSGSTNGVERAESDALLGSTRGLRRAETEKRRIGIEPVLESKNVDRVGLGPGLSPKNVGLNGNGHGNVKEVPAVTPTVEPKKDMGKAERQVEIDMFSEPQEPENPVSHRPLGMRCGLKEKPGLARLVFYGVQHYLSLAGSLVFIPLIIVPAMGGTDEETASVISTMLLVSGVTTILQSYFGTRLPLVQGSSFVYLAPALVIINSEEFRNLSGNRFRHTMRELQGAIIVGSIFQCILGYTRLMSLLLRLINPVVVAPTVAAVGLAFFSIGFPQAGTCVEISIPQISLVLLFALYLRGVSIFGHRVFKVYAVPLSVVIVWLYAFFLTAGGAYNYKGCSSDIPSSNILLDSCRRHAFTMKHCRTDASNAWRTAAWVRIPYPLQWGIPTFHFRTSIIMIIVSLVASVESVGSYHAAALLVNLSPPTPRIVSRGIGLEGFSSMLAGLWGTGTGSTTLIESVRTIDITKMANRRAMVLGAVLLIFFSFVGKVGAILASIPQALAASVLCFTWALVAALGLSTLQYGQTASSRNIIIVGFTLFMSFSVPAYFQQYQPITSIVLPSYYIPYAAASNGPVHSGSKAFDYAINALLSMNMVVALLVAFVLDNTVPGSRQERGVYIWSAADDMENDPSHLADYSLPKRICKFFRCSKCFGA